MEFKNIQYFIKIAECDSITQAANELYVSQQALSKSIRNLEQELNTRLFNRTSHGISLTEDGRYLRNKFLYLCRNFEEAKSETYMHFRTHKGQISFCVSPGFFRSVPIRFLLEFEDAYPNLTLHKIEVPDLDCEDYVRKDPHHFGLSTKPWYTNGIQYSPLYREQVYFIASKRHPLAGRKEISLSELSQDNFLFFNNSFNIHYRTLYACKSLDFTPNIIYRSADVSQLVKLASENAGILLCVKHVYEEANKDALVCIPIAENDLLYWELGLIFQNFRKLDDHSRIFANYFTNRIKKLKKELPK